MKKMSQAQPPPPPERLRILGTVERINRQAAAAGQNGRIRAAKGVIQLKKVNENHWQVWVSVAKDLDGQRYDVDNILRLRTNFISEGKLTLEFRQPPFNVMLRDCKPQELDLLVDRIKIIKEGESRLKAIADAIEEKSNKKTKDTNDASSPSSSRSSNIREKISKKLSSNNVDSSSKKVEDQNQNSNNNNDTEDQKPVRSGIKRPLASLDMSKKEATAIRKSLKLSTSTLQIANKSEYPLRGFPSDLKRLLFNNLLLKKIDYRLQDLLHLKYISMTGNRISSIDMLQHLKSQVEHLNLANNSIDKIGEDVFRAKSFARLKVLNLSGNQLRWLPNSLLELSDLMELHLSNNLLQVLPYNLHRLNILVLLKLNGNQIRALPSPISLMKLNHLDISTNPFIPANHLSGVRHSIQLEPNGNGTLFEKAAAAFLAYQHKRKVSYFHRYDASILPQIINDYLSSAKYCRLCGKMCLRYLISYHTDNQSLAQEFVRYTREYPVCLIKCDKCAGNDF